MTATQPRQATPSPGAIQSAIESKLTRAFAPHVLRVVNESYMHSVPPGSETHFKVVIVSDAFDGSNPVARHRAVNQALEDEIAAGVHALSIEARTPAEWQEREGRTTASPKCLGGSTSRAPS